MDRKQTAYARRQNSRVCTIYKKYPQCYMLEHEIGLLNIHEDSSEDEKLMEAKRKNRQQQEEEEEKKSPAIV